jgi:signal transduction histidine kinase
MTIKTLGGREMVGKPLLEAVPEFRDQDYPALLRLVLETGEPIEGRDRLVRISDGQGGLRDTYWTFIYLPLRDAHGRVEGVMTFDQEVTENVLARRKIEEQTAELARAKREAEAARAVAETANRAKDEFLAMLGHELRNPLAPIVTAVHLMRAKGMSSRELTIIERQLAHLSRLIDDLLDVARVARGKISLRKENLEIATVVDRAIEMAAPLLEEKQQRLEIDVPRTGLLVHGDATRLAQVVANLLTNAAKYSPPRSPVRLSARQDGGRILVRCEDEGIGIAPERLERVFDMFFQEPQSLDRGRGGLGLGLSIVRNFARLHGGDVRCHSEGSGRGSVFIIELPAASDPQRVSGPPAESGAAAASVPGRRRVLVVDDNKDSAELVAEALASKGCDVLIAFDGPQALKLAADRSPDVVVLDIGLPVMDGYEVAVRLRAERRSELPPVRLIALTGYGQKEDARRAARAGFDQHLVKPVDIDRLVEIVGS